MEYRPYTHNINISRIGFGAYQIGDAVQRKIMTQQYAEELILAAFNRGCNFFDTAPNYGLGKSEMILGNVLPQIRSKVAINSKCGHHADGDHIFDLERMKKTFEGSLQRLHTDYIDSLILHNPAKELLYGDSFAMQFLQALQSSRSIREYGASVDTAEEMHIILDHSDATIIEVMFNVFYQDPLSAFAKAADKGVKLIIKVPLDSGWLSGRYTADSTFDDIRSRWSRKVLEKRMAALHDLGFLDLRTRSLPLLALSFILHHNAVTTVIPGTRSLEQLYQSLSATRDSLSTAEVNMIHELYQRKWEALQLGW